MKKLVAFLGACVLLVCSVIPVFALPSVQSPGIVEVEDDGSDVKVVIDDWNKKYDDTLKLLPDDFKILDYGIVYLCGNSGCGGAELYPDEFPITAILKIPGVTKDSKVEILYFVDGKWLSAKVTFIEDGKVSVVFEKFEKEAPIVIRVDGREVVGSPNTGETNILLYGLCFAVVAFTGMIIFRKRNA